MTPGGPAVGPAVAVHPCPHCGTPVEGPVGTFCCQGCALAAEIIGDAGLDRYYADRDGFAARPEALTGIDWGAIPVSTVDGQCAAVLAVDGIRCASCVWLVEHLLQQADGVVEARVSFGTGRASIRWDPEVTDLAHIWSTVGRVGYRPRPTHVARATDRELLVRLGVAAFAAMNIMGMAAAVYAGWVGGMADRFVLLFGWTSLLLATPVALWSAEPFYKAAWAGLRVGVLHMDLPISIAVGLLYAHGVWATLSGAEAYLDSMTMLVTLLLIGRVLEARGRQQAVRDATSLAERLPRTARRVIDGSVEEVPVDALAIGDRVEVALGAEVPVDGVVVLGPASVRMALLTGESRPRRVEVGDRVIAGALVVDGALQVAATAQAADGLARRVSDLLDGVEARGAQRTSADRLAPWFTGATLLVAAVTLIAWWPAGSGVALERLVAVLVVACPCALALAHPLTVTVGLGTLARHGLLLRSSDALLDLASVDAAVLDKTGTLTVGEPRVTAADDAVLRIAAGLERRSQHPIARAVLAEAVRRGIALPAVDDVREVPGRGVTGTVDGVRYALTRAADAGSVALVGPGGIVGTLALDDRPRPDAARAVEALVALGVDVAVLTGDDAAVADRIAGEVGVSEITAGVDPLAKAAWVEDRLASGRRVVFAGDGVNDGPALTAATVGLAMGGGAASTLRVADGVVAAPGVLPIAHGVRVARAVEATIRGSLALSAVYNVVAVGAAVAGYVNPLVAAVLMPLSSALVAYRAWRIGAR